MYVRLFFYGWGLIEWGFGGETLPTPSFLFSIFSLSLFFFYFQVFRVCSQTQKKNKPKSSNPPSLTSSSIKQKQTLSTNPAHIRTLFTRINVTNAPFLVTKLRIRVLPCVIAFVDSVATDRIIGFEGLGDPPSGPPSEPQPNGDDFPTDAVEARLSAAGVLSRNEGSSLLLRHQKQRGGRNGDGDDDDGEEDDDDDG